MKRPAISPELKKKFREVQKLKKLPLADQFDRLIYGSEERQAEIEKATEK